MRRTLMLARVAIVVPLAGLIAYAVASAEHPCDRNGPWILLVPLFLCPLLATLCSLPELRFGIAAGSGIAVAVAMSLATALEISGDGMISPSGLQCETNWFVSANLVALVSLGALAPLLAILLALQMQKED